MTDLQPVRGKTGPGCRGETFSETKCLKKERSQTEEEGDIAVVKKGGKRVYESRGKRTPSLIASWVTRRATTTKDMLVTQEDDRSTGRGAVERSSVAERWKRQGLLLG